MNATTFFNEVFLAVGLTVGAMVVGMLINHWRISLRYYPRDRPWPKLAGREHPDRRRVRPAGTSKAD